LPKLPIVSGAQLIKFLAGFGYQEVRQKGSHLRLRAALESGDHNITVPNHPEIAKGTLNDILTRVAERLNLSKDDLIKRLSRL
jgi:predicted RNA binding protein YcfA (HicA-like mRNA interferase family)